MHSKSHSDNNPRRSSEREEQLWEAFKAGFNTSFEGWSGDCVGPTGSGTWGDEDEQDLREAFERWQATQLS